MGYWLDVIGEEEDAGKMPTILDRRSAMSLHFQHFSFSAFQHLPEHPAHQRERGRDGRDENQATAAPVAHAGAGDAECGVTPPARALADPKSPPTDRIADARVAQVHPEWS